MAWTHDNDFKTISEECSDYLQEEITEDQIKRLTPPQRRRLIMLYRQLLKEDEMRNIIKSGEGKPYQEDKITFYQIRH